MSFIDFILLVCFKDHYKMECIYKMNDIAAHTLALFCSFPTKLKQSILLGAKYGSKQRCRAQIITHLVIKTNQQAKCIRTAARKGARASFACWYNKRKGRLNQQSMRIKQPTTLHQLAPRHVSQAKQVRTAIQKSS